MEITRTSILREVLTDKEDQMFKYSKYRAGLTPLEGYEQIFADLRKTCDLLREMLREQLGAPAVAPADWQKDLMDGNQPDMSWANRTPDDLLRRRRHQRAEDFKPNPVTYPGGEE